MKCLYHANCADGSGAAMAVWKKYGDVGHEYIPCQYGDPLPLGMNGCDVIMVDFTAKKLQTQYLATVAKSILIIDHHKSAQADLDGVDDGRGCPIDTVFDLDKSGAVLAWEHFHATPVPQILLHIQDRDLWRFDLLKTKDITKGLQLYLDFRDWLDLDLDDLEKQGRPINKFIEQQIWRILAAPQTDLEVTGDSVPVYNLPGFMVSDALHVALDWSPDAPYAIAYFDLPGKRVYSLRSRSGSDVDVSEIAVRHGGGGHKHAAGFSVPFGGQVNDRR